MRYGSVCSGIEAATVAWHSLGWEPAWFSEIEAFPSAVLKHRYPKVDNRGDMTKFKGWRDEPIELLVGGTPCQSFSVAGLRKGMEDPRGNLALVFLAIADRFRPEWVVWENVPGVLSSAEGRDFGCFLGGLGELGYGFAYRVLDAQYFGVPQRRRRVFVVGHLGDWRRAAAVLFERHCLQGNASPRRKEGEDIAPCLDRGAGSCSQNDFNTSGGLIPEVSYAINAKGGSGRSDAESETFIPIGFNYESLHHEGYAHGIQPTLKKAGTPSICQAGVRRLTPKECERLQGFPDDYTRVPYRGKDEPPDGPRYEALGNSMAVPVMNWIGRRLVPTS